MKATKQKLIDELHEVETQIMARQSAGLSDNYVAHIGNIAKALYYIERACDIIYAEEQKEAKRIAKVNE